MDAFGMPARVAKQDRVAAVARLTGSPAFASCCLLPAATVRVKDTTIEEVHIPRIVLVTEDTIFFEYRASTAEAKMS